MKSFTLENVTYQLEPVKCGKPGCKRCPHGPYWYAYWWYFGTTQKRYVGKHLPDGVKEPDAPPAAPPPPKPLTDRQARKLLGLTVWTKYATGLKKWMALREAAERKGEAGRAELVRIDAAWQVVCGDLR